MINRIDDNYIFHTAAGLDCQIEGWQQFAMKAQPGARSEAMLILNANHVPPCKKANLLRRLMQRWGAAIACILLTLCTARAAAPQPVTVEVAVPDESEAYIPAVMTAAVLEVVNDRVRVKYPGLVRYARERGYRIVVADLPVDEDGSQIQGRHTGARRLIEIHYTLGTSPARLAEVYAHEVGHAIYEGLSHIERQTIIDEYAAARRDGMPDADINEVFAMLTSRIATGRLTTRLPAAQRIIRRRICK